VSNSTQEVLKPWNYLHYGVAQVETEKRSSIFSYLREWSDYKVAMERYTF